jgi:cyclopropane fatty-acyl-phospholipid synthase-like methyltransferase
MAALREALIRNYAQHYARHNDNLGPTRLADAARNALDATYGDIVTALAPGSEVLDLGCGSGYLLAWLSSRSGLRVVGVDSSQSQVAVSARELPAVHVECDDALAYLRRCRDRFAAVFCLDVLEHIGDDVIFEWLSAAHEALLPGGYFICKVPNAANLTAAQLRYIDLTHVRSFTASSVEQLVEAAGFEQCQVLPVRSGHLSGAIRETIEWAAHKVVFRVCGDSREEIFTRTLVGVGRKRSTAV